MGKTVLYCGAVVALAAVAAGGAWVYGGSWFGSYHGQGIAVTPEGVVYLDDPHLMQIKYFTSAGSALGSWPLGLTFYE